MLEKFQVSELHCRDKIFVMIFSNVYLSKGLTVLTLPDIILFAKNSLKPFFFFRLEKLILAKLCLRAAQLL